MAGAAHWFGMDAPTVLVNTPWTFSNSRAAHIASQNLDGAPLTPISPNASTIVRTAERSLSLLLTFSIPGDGCGPRGCANRNRHSNLLGVLNL